MRDHLFDLSGAAPRERPETLFPSTLERRPLAANHTRYGSRTGPRIEGNQERGEIQCRLRSPGGHFPRRPLDSEHDELGVYELGNSDGNVVYIGSPSQVCRRL